MCPPPTLKWMPRMEAAPTGAPEKQFQVLQGISGTFSGRCGEGCAELPQFFQ